MILLKNNTRALHSMVYSVWKRICIRLGKPADSIRSVIQWNKADASFIKKRRKRLWTVKFERPSWYDGGYEWHSIPYATLFMQFFFHVRRSFRLSRSRGQTPFGKAYAGNGLISKRTLRQIESKHAEQSFGLKYRGFSCTAWPEKSFNVLQYIM